MPRATVEVSCSLDLAYLERHDLLRPGHQVTLAYSWSYGGQPAGSILVLSSEAEVRLCYQTCDGTVDERAALEWGTPGGYRVYFLCPRCGRRARQLHLPFGKTRFGCRVCHNLAYQSQQEHLSPWMRAIRWRDRAPRRGPRFGRRMLEALAVAETGDWARVDPSWARIERSIERDRQRWGKPGRPSKEALQERKRREKLRAQGLLDLWGNELPSPPKWGPGRPKEKRAYQWREPRDKQPLGPGEAYCVKCKQARRLVYAREGVLSNGRPALLGRCQVCRTRLCRMIQSKQAFSQPS